MVATTTLAGDDPIVELGAQAGWLLSRGSEMDLLERYLEAARAHEAARVVRITSDCPLIDPDVIDEVVAALDAAGADYASNTLEPRTFPRGLDVEAMTMDALEAADRDDLDPASREHATPYLYRHPERFRLAGVRLSEDLSAHRWTVDTPEDYELVRRIYDELGRDDFAWREALAVIEREPRLVRAQPARRAEDGARIMIARSAPPTALVLRADASTAAGTGHMMRTLALAQAWLDAGGQARWLVADAPPPCSSASLTRASRSSPSGPGAEPRMQPSSAPPWPPIPPRRRRRRHPVRQPVPRSPRRHVRGRVLLSRTGRPATYPVGFLLNQNAHADRAAYPADATCRFLLGTPLYAAPSGVRPGRPAAGPRRPSPTTCW